MHSIKNLLGEFEKEMDGQGLERDIRQREGFLMDERPEHG